MYGIDISNWQAGLNVDKLASQIDFAFCKATEGLNYVDKTCNGFVADFKRNNLLWGFYHFARENNPTTEADFFYNNTKDYFGLGLPVLDYETGGNSNPAQWVETFCKRIYELSGIYPVVYLSASWIDSSISTWTAAHCPLWVAGYPSARTSFGDWPFPYSVPRGKMIIWQFTSSLRLNGYNGNLDGNIGYISKNEWLKYATGNVGKWIKNKHGWWYEYPDGTWPKNQWLKINGKWYWFYNSGYIAENTFVQIGGKWYAFDKSGAMVESANRFSVSKNGDITIN